MLRQEPTIPPARELGVVSVIWTFHLKSWFIYQESTLHMFCWKGMLYAWSQEHNKEMYLLLGWVKVLLCEMFVVHASRKLGCKLYPFNRVAYWHHCSCDKLWASRAAPHYLSTMEVRAMLWNHTEDRVVKDEREHPCVINVQEQTGKWIQVACRHNGTFCLISQWR